MAQWKHPDVLGRLRRDPVDPAYLTAAQKITGGSLGLRTEERFVVVFEEEHAELAAALVAAADEIGAPAEAVLVEPEADPAFVRGLERRLATCEVSVLIAGRGASRAVRRAAIQTDHRRHGHLIGVTDAVIRQSLRADLPRVHALGARLLDVLSAPGPIEVESPGGTQLTAVPDPLCHWHNHGGNQSAPGWTNLPAGEVTGSPASIDGVFVPDGGVWLTDGRVIDRVAALRLRLSFERGVLADVDGPAEAVRTLLEHLDTDAQYGRRVGQITFGTNVEVLAPIGVYCQDAMLPGFHLVLGFTAPQVTQASWCGELLVPLLQRQATVRVAGREILHRGKYAADIADV